MPSTPKTPLDPSIIFFPLLILTLVLWLFYRTVFHFPVWFDETVGKALFFGIPVWLYISITQGKQIVKTFSWDKFESGILLGLAFGGIYGFVTSLMIVINQGGQVKPALLLVSPDFWNQFLLALCTGFWETLLFFSFIQTVISQRYPRWSMGQQVLLTAGIFLIFHLPNMLLRANLVAVYWQFLLLTFFALGQALIFYRTRNSYILILSQAFWGLVLITHGG